MLEKGKNILVHPSKWIQMVDYQIEQNIESWLGLSPFRKFGKWVGLARDPVLSDRIGKGDNPNYITQTSQTTRISAQGDLPHFQNVWKLNIMSTNAFGWFSFQWG